MISATSAVNTLLANARATTKKGVARVVLTITLADGTVLRWARHSADVTFGGTTWLAHGKGGRPIIRPFRCRSVMGLEQIGGAEITLDCGETAVLSSNVLADSRSLDISPPWYGSGLSVTPNAALAPDGTMTAEAFTATDTDPMRRQTLPAATVAGQTFTWSVWLRGGAGSIGKEARLFSYGTTGLEAMVMQGFVLTAEWQLCSITVPVPATPVSTDWEFRFDPVDSDVVVGDVVYAWNAQAVSSERLTMAAKRGAFRDATLLFERVYAESPDQPYVGKLYRFFGTIMSAVPDSHSVRLSVESITARLKTRTLPRTVLSPSCGNALGDAACGIDRATITTSTTVLAGSTSRVLVVNGTWADGYWDLGSVAIGSPATARSGVRSSVNNALTLTTPLAAVPAPGTAIAITRGCDLTTGAKGCAGFNNLARFRGTPHLPRET